MTNNSVPWATDEWRRGECTRCHSVDVDVQDTGIGVFCEGCQRHMENMALLTRAARVD